MVEIMESDEFNRLRRDLGMSVAKLAAKLGISWRQCQRYAQGKTPIPEPIARLLRLLAELRPR